MKTIVIGSVAAGTSAAAKARRNDEEMEITVYDKDIDISYSVCGIPYYVGTDLERSDLTPRDGQWFQERFDIEVKTGYKVVAIDHEQREVRVKNLTSGNQFKDNYDKLVLATGATPIKPPIPGIDKENIFTVRNVVSGEQIKDFVLTEQPEQAVVLGAGYVGLEMVDNLVERGMEVTLIEQADQVLTPLDKDMTVRIEDYLKKQGVNLILEDKVTKVRGRQAVTQVVTASGQEIAADMLVVAAGVEPNVELAEKIGVELGASGAIKVNRRMETNLRDVYAVGDCVESYSLITGQPFYRPLGTVANKMGRIAGDQLTGGSLTFRGILGTGIVKLFDWAIGYTGLSEKEAQELGYETEVIYNIKPNQSKYFPGSSNLVIKAVANKNTAELLGGQIIGKRGVDKRLDVFVTAITYGATVDDLFHLDLAYSPPFSSTKDPVMYTGMILTNNLERGVETITPQELATRQEAGEKIKIIDVRDREQYREGHVEGAVSIPLSELRGKAEELDQEMTTVTYCNKGTTGNAAQNLLLNLGFKEVYNLAGGHQNYQWQQKVKEED